MSAFKTCHWADNQIWTKPSSLHPSIDDLLTEIAVSQTHIFAGMFFNFLPLESRAAFAVNLGAAGLYLICSVVAF